MVYETSMEKNKKTEVFTKELMKGKEENRTLTECDKKQKSTISTRKFGHHPPVQPPDSMIQQERKVGVAEKDEKDRKQIAEGLRTLMREEKIMQFDMF